VNTEKPPHDGAALLAVSCRVFGWEKDRFISSNNPVLIPDFAAFFGGFCGLGVELLDIVTRPSHARTVSGHYATRV